MRSFDPGLCRSAIQERFHSACAGCGSQPASRERAADEIRSRLREGSAHRGVYLPPELVAERTLPRGDHLYERIAKTQVSRPIRTVVLRRSGRGTHLLVDLARPLRVDPAQPRHPAQPPAGAPSPRRRPGLVPERDPFSSPTTDRGARPAECTARRVSSREDDVSSSSLLRQQLRQQLAPQLLPTPLPVAGWLRLLLQVLRKAVSDSLSGARGQVSSTRDQKAKSRSGAPPPGAKVSSRT